MRSDSQSMLRYRSDSTTVSGKAKRSAWGRGIGMQLVRYIIVGVVTNVFIFGAYLLLTGAGAGHKLAMTTLYAVGTLQSFVWNRSWTFEHRGAGRSSLSRFIVAYFCGYLLNWIGLYVLVDHLRLPHQLVQGGLIIAVALFLFGIQRHWVFRSREN